MLGRQASRPEARLRAAPHGRETRRNGAPDGPDVSPEQYDAWYRTPRGAWIGETEHRLLRKALAPLPNETSARRRLRHG